ncbi:hypothetical protein GCM10010384_64610 [Streptomyces djakartensis]|uniref:Uncharacterized protein n=1 Tax=Streptomyces djakartensis TaxID=68193 RepID=A0ABQ3AFN9_9ACTN|nr:hypothetical protein GCM10010384_64610 [Streptomyces djakartensis]
MAGSAAANGPGGGQPVRKIGERPSRGGQQFEARWGEHDASWFAAEQRVADLVFEAADLLAQRWLGDAQAGGRMAEVKFLGEHDEGVQLWEGEFGALHTPRDIRPCLQLY